MSKVHVYLDLGSQPSRTVLWLCRLLKVPHELHVLRLDKGDSKTPDYLKIHPMGKVPAIVYEDRPMIESSAICIWLCQKFGGEKYFPRSPDAQFPVNSYLGWHNTFRGGCAGFFGGAIMRPVAAGKKLEAERVARLEKNLDDVLRLLENVWLNGKPYICGDNVTLADLQAINELNQVLPFHSTCLSKYPQIRNWVSRMELYPGYNEMMEGWNKVAKLLTGRHSKL